MTISFAKSVLLLCCSYNATLEADGKVDSYCSIACLHTIKNLCREN